MIPLYSTFKIAYRQLLALSQNTRDPMFDRHVPLYCSTSKLLSFHCSYYASATSFPVGPPRIVPPLKRQRLMAATARSAKANPPQKANTIPPLDQLKVYSKWKSKFISCVRLTGFNRAVVQLWSVDWGQKCNATSLKISDVSLAFSKRTNSL